MNVVNGVIIHDESSPKMKILVKYLISSFVFKNALLYLINEEKYARECDVVKSKTDSSELLIITRRLLRILNKFILDHKMPYFIITGHDIIHNFLEYNFLAVYRNAVCQLMLCCVLDNDNPIKLFSQKGRPWNALTAEIRKHRLSKLVRRYLGALTDAVPY